MNVPSLSIGGTSVIIVVGVALETVQALESQMLMRQYKASWNKREGVSIEADPVGAPAPVREHRQKSCAEN